VTEVDRQRVKDIFAEAIEKPASDRMAFVDATCGADADLRERVRRLLKVHETAGEFLAEPTGRFGPERFVVPGESVGDTIGHYTLLELIGEGGFGSVYLARQEHPVRRQVALKIIKLGMDTRQVIARFDAEKQALAMMDHPNIARVFDAGVTELGRPYFVMEYVPGVPVTQFCDERQLTPRQRLDLFMSVCAAVQHAHQKASSTVTSSRPTCSCRCRTTGRS
jgi:serine/threonine protein kinase